MHLLQSLRHAPRLTTALARARPTIPPLPSHFYTTRMSSSMSKRLAGKTILITGASSGIGKATAIEFAKTQPDDLKLILTARREDALKEVKKEIEGFAKGVKVLTVKLDVSKVAEIEGFVGGLGEEWRDVDVLVNNAGLVKGVAQAPEISTADIDTMFSTSTSTHAYAQVR